MKLADAGYSSGVINWQSSARRVESPQSNLLARARCACYDH